MTTHMAPFVPERPRLRTGEVVAAGFGQLRDVLCSILVVLPLALIAEPGPSRYIGIGYAVAYGVFFAPSTTLSLVAIRDAWRLYRYRRPISLQAVMERHAVEMRRHSGRTVLPKAVNGRPSWFTAWSVRLNPIAGIAVTMLNQAISWRGPLVADMWRDAQARYARLGRDVVLLDELGQDYRESFFERTYTHVHAATECYADAG